MALARAFFLLVISGSLGCSGGGDGASPPVTQGTDGGVTPPGPAGPGDGGASDGSTPPGPGASEQWVKGLPMDYALARVLAHPSGGVVVYGRRTAPTEGAFAASFDRFGAQTWNAALGAGYVARMSLAKSGFLVTGSRTTNFSSGIAPAFISKVGYDGAVGFQTEIPFSLGYARGLGVGEGSDGNLTFVGLTPTSVSSGWDIVVARFSSTGAKTGENVFGKDQFVESVGDAIIDSSGNAYALTMHGYIPSGLLKLSPAGDILWSAGEPPDGRLAFDAAGNVLVLKRDKVSPYSPSGDPLPKVIWTQSPDDDSSYDLAVGPQGQIAIAGSRRFSTTTPRSDVLVVIRDVTGKLTEMRPFSSSKTAAATGIAFDKDGGLVIAGQFEGELTLDATKTVIKSADGPYFVARMPPP